jgi:hypothetical protein
MSIRQKWPAFVMLGLILLGLWLAWADHTRDSDGYTYRCLSLLILLTLGGFLAVRSSQWNALWKPKPARTLPILPVLLLPLAIRFLVNIDVFFWTSLILYLGIALLIVRFEFWPRPACES